jgi:hypothetical protein
LSALRRRLALDRVEAPAGVPWLRLALGLLVPGVAFWLRGRSPWAFPASCLCALLAGVFIVCFGLPPANIAFGLLISVHGFGFAWLCEPWLPNSSSRARILYSLGALLLIGGLIYQPLRSYIQRRWVMPIQVRNRVVLVQPFADPAAASRSPSLNRGDWVAYRVPDGGSHQVFIRGGIGFDRVLALPGDLVRFEQRGYSINGVTTPLRPDMPRQRDWVVPEKHWFIWPDLGIGGHGAVPGGALSEAMMDLATVSQEQLIGKPYERWFWRRQVPL